MVSRICTTQVCGVQDWSEFVTDAAIIDSSDSDDSDDNGKEE